MMYKTILAVVAFLFVALAVQLYEQNRLQVRIVRQQEEVERAELDKEAKAAIGIHSKLEPVSDSLVPESFSVPTGTPKEFSITVDTSRMADVSIAGHFAVSSSRNSGVEVYVFDEDDYTNWLYGNNSVAIYSSGRESMGDVRVRLAKSGRYYLVFRNSTSPATVDVTANIRMQYEKVTTPS